MSYDHRLLCKRISQCLHRNPNSSLRQIAGELHLSRRTIQNAVVAVTGKKFCELRQEVLLERIEKVLSSVANATIRRLSCEAGYKCSRSFARAVRRAWGVTPRELRTRIAEELLASKAEQLFRDLL